MHVYAWGNNPRRAELKGRRCVVEARGRMGTVLVRFLDTGERVTTSYRALRFTTSKSLMPLSITVGISGSAGLRSRLVTASAFTLPCLW